MSFLEWIWLIVIAAGVVIAVQAWRQNLDYHGAAMARAAGIRIGLCIAGFGAVLFLIALAL